LFFCGIGILPMRQGIEARYMFSAKGAAFHSSLGHGLFRAFIEIMFVSAEGAVLIRAWGSAPGADTLHERQR
jgi:hypothetical protein